jgi:hypothetical protein
LFGKSYWWTPASLRLTEQSSTSAVPAAAAAASGQIVCCPSTLLGSGAPTWASNRHNDSSGLHTCAGSCCPPCTSSSSTSPDYATPPPTSMYPSNRCPTAFRCLEFVSKEFRCLGSRWSNLNPHAGLAISHVVSKRAQLGLVQRGVIRWSLIKEFPDQSSGPITVLTGHVLAAAQKAGEDLDLSLLIMTSAFANLSYDTQQDHGCPRKALLCS